MENKPPLSTGKTILWVYGMIAAFTAAYLAVPIFLERRTRKRQR
jgi:polyferredoxin